MKQRILYLFFGLLIFTISMGCGQTESNPVIPANYPTGGWSNWDGEFSFSPSSERLRDDYFEVRWTGYSDHPPFRVVVDPKTTGSAPTVETVLKENDSHWGRYEYSWYCITTSEWSYWIDEAKYLIKIVLVDESGKTTGVVLASHIYKYHD
ncbi:hypothetical protein ACFL14_03165 [Patescibacteria group bacterium]